MAWRRVAMVAAGAALVAVGLALGAESQREAFLGKDAATQSQEAERGAAVNIVPLTAILVGIGAAIVCTAFGGGWLWGAGIGVAAWLLDILLQTSYANYDVWRGGGIQGATLSINPLIHDARGSAVLYVSAMAVVAGLFLVCGWLGRRVLSRPPTAPAISAYRGAVMLQTPFLAVACTGALTLVLGLRLADKGTTPYLLYLPLVTLLCAALLVLPFVRLAHLAAASRDPRLAPVAREALPPLRRIEDVLWALLLVLTLVGAWLPALKPEALQLGRTLGADLRFASLLMTTLIVPAIPALLLRRRLVDAIGEPAPPITFEAAMAGSSLGLAALACLSGGALLPWLAALAPPAVVAFRARPGPALVVPMLLALVVWGYGNTLSGSSNGGVLSLEVEVGLLSLLRLLAAVLGAAVVARLLWHLGGKPLPAIAAGALLSLAVLLETPLHAWFSDDRSILAVGSLVASLSPDLRATVHVLAAASAAAGAVVSARLLRPGWFRRGKQPIATAKAAATSSQA